eukprot:GHVO01062191.1.p1 GENE.GHVO01062191.1~~GHVO01062191.1.p1  ORF type:complete len:118 (+),score=6.77 GHVO01062191.1:1154-1507(+)
MKSESLIYLLLSVSVRSTFILSRTWTVFMRRSSGFLFSSEFGQNSSGMIMLDQLQLMSDLKVCMKWARFDVRNCFVPAGDLALLVDTSHPMIRPELEKALDRSRKILQSRGKFCLQV